MKKRFIPSVLLLPGLLILAIAFPRPASGQVPTRQGKPVPAGFHVTPAVQELYDKINDYRQQNNLPPVRLSRSLCYVAALHVKDLALHHPDNGPCNSYSWSGEGFWKPFCYPRDENKKNSVWDKPRELTQYPARAYEIIYWENVKLTPDSVLAVWKTEDYFNNFLLNGGKWQGIGWKAIGIAMNDNYASAWFGEAADPEDISKPAESAVKPSVKDTAKPVVTVKKPAPPVKKPKIKKVRPVQTDSLAVKPADTVPARVAAPPAGQDTVARTYYIIIRTNLTLAAANRLAAELRAGDYPAATVITKDDKIRVSVFDSPVKTIAVAKLREIKKRYRDAWLFKCEP